jgi:hypothetical protein
MEELLEIFIVQEIINQRSVLGPQLPGGGLGFFGVAGDIEALMVLGPGEGTEAGRNGIVRARLDVDSVGRIGVDQMQGGAVPDGRRRVAPTS